MTPETSPFAVIAIVLVGLVVGGLLAFFIVDVSRSLPR